MGIIGQHKAGLVASGVLSVFGAFCGLVPYVVVYLIAGDLFVGEPRTDRVGLLVSIAAGGVAGKALFRLWADSVSHRTAYSALADIRLALADRLGRMPLARARARSHGHIKKVFQDDVEQLELGLSHAVPDIAASVTVPLSVLAVMFWVDWRMALAGVAVVLCVVACVIGSVVATKDLMVDESEAKKSLNIGAVSFVRGIKVIRGFVGSSTAYRSLYGAIEEVENVENAKTSRGRVGAAGATTFCAVSVVFILPLGLYLFHNGSLSAADLIFFLLVGVGFAQPLMAMTLSAAVLQYQVESGVKNISEILEEPDLPVVESPVGPTGSAVELDEVSFSYGDRQIIDRLTLRIEPGEKVALVGGSGAGKTTVLRLIARFLDADEGRVRFGGVDVRHLDPAQLARSIAFIQQDDYIFNDTLMNNIRLARPDASDHDVRQAAEHARVTDFVDELDDGWDTVLRSGGGRLSGGQRQRISIARAFLADARVIMFDEATASLDAGNERAVVEAMTLLQEGRTVITVAHRIGSLTDHERILVLESGSVADEGSHDDLLGRCPIYRQLWDDFVSVDSWRLSADGAPASPRTSDAIGSGDKAPVSTVEPGDVTSYTEPVHGLAQMRPVRQWFAMLGHHAQTLWRAGLWRLLLEGSLTSAPVLVVFLSLLWVLEGTLDGSDVVLLSLILWGLFLSRLAIGVEVARFWWPVANRAISDLRRSVIRRLMRAPMGVFDRMDAGRTSTLIVSDLALMDFINMPSKLIIACVQPVMVTIALLALDWRMALAALMGVPVFIVVGMMSDRVQAGTSAEVSHARRDANRSLLEYCQGVAVLRAFPDAPQAEIYRDRTEALKEASVRMAIRTGPLTALANIVLEVGFVALLWLGAHLFQSDALPAVTFLIFLVVALNLYRPFQELLELSSYRNQQVQIASALGEVWEVDELVESTSPEVPSDARVEFRDVWFSYGDDPVLRGVDIRADPGTVTALVGPSGAGKSTITNLVARFWDPDSGQVRVGGVDLRQIAPEVRRDMITTVYQEVYLFPDTVRANLTVGRPSAPDHQIWEALESAESAEFVRALPDGLDTVLTEGGGNLSGGQRQRLSIARALLKDAPVLLLDEAVASVDAGTARRIQAALGRLAASRTVLVVAHRLNTIETADQIVVLDHGRVDGAAPHAELVESSHVYRHLLDAPV